MGARLAAMTLAVAALAACIGDAPRDDPDDPLLVEPDGPFTVTSPAFEPGQRIPAEYTCDGENVNPVLHFTSLPLATRTLALIMDDPDAPFGTVLHWTFWNLPANVTELPRDADMQSLGAREGRPYSGSCPPDGEHRYFFYAYAVDAELDLAEGASRDDLEAALAPHTVATDEMYGTYNRLPVDLPLPPR